VKSWI